MRDGAIVQLGTPEELVGSPADDYVENFTRDIPRSHVLTLRWIMRDPEPGEQTDGPRLDVATTVRRAVPVLAASEKPVLLCRERRRRRASSIANAVLTAIAGEGETTDMASVAAAETVLPGPVVTHRPWWRGKLVQVAGIVALMYVAYRLRPLEYPWPERLEWNALTGHLDDFQIWLIDERNAEDQSVVFGIFDGFATFVDDLVDWFDQAAALADVGRDDGCRHAGRPALRRVARSRVGRRSVRDLCAHSGCGRRACRRSP